MNMVNMWVYYMMRVSYGIISRRKDMGLTGHMIHDWYNIIYGLLNSLKSMVNNG